MEITTDIILRGTAWCNLLSSMSKIFSKKAHYDLFVLCTAVGIMYDSQIEQLPGHDTEEPKTVPRVVLGNNRDFIELLFQTAVMTSTSLEMSEDERLKLAFDDEKTEFKKFDFLVKFANFGAIKLADRSGVTIFETMDSLKNYFVSIVDGLNLDLNPLTDADLDFDDFDIE